MTNTTEWKRRLAVAVVVILVGIYDLWAVRAEGIKFNWGFELSEYYDLLGRAFASGHLYLPVEPSAQLLSQPNPWDPNIDSSLKLSDAVLFNRHYYLYFGAAPALLLFTPWRLATGHDLPQNFACHPFLQPRSQRRVPQRLARSGLEVLVPPARSQVQGVSQRQGLETPQTISFFSISNMYGGAECTIRDDGHNWEPCLRNGHRFQSKSLLEPYFDIYYAIDKPGQPRSDLIPSLTLWS